MRLSFRLDADSAEVWRKLRQKHEWHSDAYILRELLRAEDFRMQGNTKDDKINEIRLMVRKLLKLQEKTDV